MDTPHVIVYGTVVVGPFPSREAALAAQHAADPADLRTDAARPLIAPVSVRDCAVCKGKPGNENCRYCRGRGVLARRAAKG